LTMFEAKPLSGPVAVVVAEDDALIRELVALVFQDAGFDVVEAQYAAEAFEALENLNLSVAALFSDIHMPGSLGGLALAVLAKALCDRRRGDVCARRVGA
jgi:CheY-like chemotaxis protein